MLTNWGYEIDSESLPDMLTVEEFNAATGNRYAAQDVEGQIHAAQSAIRDWCGWHVYPELSCTFTDDSLPRKRVIQLPATHVSAVGSATVDGVEVSSKAKRNGLVRLDVPTCTDEWETIEVTYTAGVQDASVIKDLIIHRVVHAFAVPAGVQSETAGGVSITYTSSWTSNNRATNLPDDNLRVLSPYRVRTVV